MGCGRLAAQELVEKGAEKRRDWTKGQRKEGVNREKGWSKIKKSTKILLTEISSSQDTPDAPVTAFPPEEFRTFLSYPQPGNNVSKEHRCLHK